MPKPDKWLTLESHTLATYNAWDTVATALLARELTRELDRTKQLQFYREEVWSNLPAVLAMQQRGLPYDVPAKALYRRRLRAELAEIDELLRADFARTTPIPNDVAAQVVTRFVAWLFPTKKNSRRSLFTKGEWAKVSKWTSEGFNPGSDAQLRVWLFKTLGLRFTTKTKGGTPSVDQDALNRLLQRKPITKTEAALIEAATPIIHNLMHRSRLAKIDEDYLDPPITNDRVYPTIKMIGTKSGRFAYARPPVHSWPPEIRHTVKAKPGHVIISFDMKAIEARIFSLVTDDKKDWDIFVNNVKYPKDPQWDIHIRTACEFFEWTLEQFMAQPEDIQEGGRTVAKTGRYGWFLYGGKPESAKTKTVCACPRCVAKVPPTINLTVARKKQIVQRWFANHPNALRYREKISEEVMRTGRLRDPVFGQTWFFHGPFGEDVEREAWNRRIQANATIILRRGLRRMHAAKLPVFLEHHDALYLESPERDVEQHVADGRGMLEEPVGEFGGVSFPCSVKVGASWGELAKV